MKTSKKILIIADNFKKIKAASDTSLFIAQEAINQTYEVHWCEPQNIYFVNYCIFVKNIFQIKNIFENDFSYEQLTSSLPLENYDYCLIRKDPPFDEYYKDLCWILSTQSKTKIANPPEILLAFHEKALQWKAFSDGILKKENLVSTCLSNNLEIIEDYCIQNQQEFLDGYICKPWLGHGGEEVLSFQNLPDLLNHLKQRNFVENKKYIMVQPFLKNIHTDGDRRVIVSGGEVICDFVRIPAMGKIASNLAQGGSAIIREMTPEQKNICKKIAVYLDKLNIHLAGLDVINQKIGEINITSPTGLKTYFKLTGENKAKQVFKNLIR